MEKELDLNVFTKEELDTLVYGELGFCGCGDPQLSLEFLKEVLTQLHLIFKIGRSKGYWNLFEPNYTNAWDGFYLKLGRESNPAMYWTYLYWLDHLDLTKHGTSVPGWLTAKGEKLLRTLEGLDFDKFFEED